MSLTDFIATPEIRALFSRFAADKNWKLPPAQRKVGLPDIRYAAAIGTAFDYMARFRLAALAHQRGVNWQNGRWIAEISLAIMKKRKMPCAERWERLIAAARRLEQDLMNGHPIAPQRLAICVQYLGAADLLYRTGAFREDFKEAPVVTSQLIELDDGMDYEALLPKQESKLILNPILEVGDIFLGGADPDIVSGDCIIDIKTTLKPATDSQRLRQVCGYAVLSTLERNFPHIQRVGFSFPRQNLFVHYTLDEIFEGRWEDFRDGFIDAMGIPAKNLTPPRM